MRLANRFRIWRRDHKHISQKEFARILGVAHATVSAIEQGKRGAGPQVLKKFQALVARHEAARKVSNG